MKTNRRLYFWIFAIVTLLTIAVTPQDTFAVAKGTVAKTQTVYVPVYSELFISAQKTPIRLTNIVVIRNVDIDNEIKVLSAYYYDTKGLLLKNFYPEPINLAPLETARIYLSEQDQEAGIGANFIIRWNAENAVNTPIIESLMVGSHGRSFVSPSRVLREKGDVMTK